MNSCFTRFFCFLCLLVLSLRPTLFSFGMHAEKIFTPLDDSIIIEKPFDLHQPQIVHHYLNGNRVNRNLPDTSFAEKIRCPLSIFYGEGIIRIQEEEEKDIYPILEHFVDSVMTTLDTNKQKEVTLYIEGFDDEFSFYYDKAKYLEQKYEVDQLDLSTYHAMISYDRAIQVCGHLEKHMMGISKWSARYPQIIFHFSCSGNGDEVPQSSSGKIPEEDKRRTVKIYFVLS